MTMLDAGTTRQEARDVMTALHGELPETELLRLLADYVVHQVVFSSQGNMERFKLQRIKELRDKL